MTERLNVSFEEGIAARVRACGSRYKGGASGYLTKLVKDDVLREAGQSMARWYARNPTAAEDALEENAAALDEIDEAR